jgi:hypothetical protein
MIERILYSSNSFHNKGDVKHQSQVRGKGVEGVGKGGGDRVHS